MNATTKFLTPPWEMDTAAERLTYEEAAWNAHDAGQIAEGYADTLEMRDGLTVVTSKDALKDFLRERFAKQLDYTVRLDLWGALKGRMAVRFEAEWHDTKNQWFRSYGVVVYQFNERGEIERRFASQETATIATSDRRL